MIDVPTGGSTGLSHEHTAALDEAEAWLASAPPERIDRPIVPLLCERFGLSRKEAGEICRQANLRLARAA